MISTDLRRGGAKRFIEGTCGESIEAPSHACIDRLQTTFRTALLRRYSHAIKGEIEIACNEDPDECSTMELVERRYIESHNHSLVAEWERRKLAITQDFRRDRKNVRDAERAQAQADEADRQARERLRSFGAAMQKAFEKPPTNVVYMKECRLDADCPNNGHCFKQDTFSGICAAR